MKIVFGEPDNMFRLAAAALSPSAAGDRFLADYFRAEGFDGPRLARQWAANYTLPAGVDVVLCDDDQTFAHEIAGADMVVVEKQPVTKIHLARAKTLKLVQVFGRNLSAVDRAACARRQIPIQSIDRPSNHLVAEQTVTLMLALTHRLDDARRGFDRPSALPPSGWAYNWAGCRNIRGLVGSTIGLVGFGEIGRLVAGYLSSFPVKLIYTRKTPDPRDESEAIATYASLDALVAQSDIISIHVPGVAATSHLLDAQILSKAKPGTYIVNTSRGSVLDEMALVDALREGRLAGAALDVFSAEPLPADHPFRQLDNVILTPHVSGGSRDERWLEGELGPIARAVIDLAAAIDL